VARVDEALEGIVVDQKNGLLAHTVAELADGLRRLLHDDDLRQRMAAAALQQARQFDIDVVSRRFAALYARLAAR
jgi:glycosyltransferase involved in cell wall biosynthesis